MKEILETERLLLREFETSDANSLYHLNLNLEVIKYTGDLPFNDIADAEKFIQNYSEYDKNGFGRWAVIEKSSGKFIGWCGLKLNEENQVDIGFRVNRAEWGKGFATESAEACLKYGFKKLHLNIIVARTSENNYPSRKVLEKIGMRFWKKQHCEGLGETIYYKIEK